MSWEEGTRLYNAGEFWEAHEAWEPLWLATRSPDLRGHIQAAAALLKVRQGNLNGARRNWAKALQNLGAHAFRARLEEFLRPLEEGELPDWRGFPRL